MIGVLREPGLDYVGEFGPPPSHHAQGSDLVEVSFSILRPPGVAKDLRIQTFSFDVYVSSYQQVFKYCKLVTISLCISSYVLCNIPDKRYNRQR